LAAQAVVSSGVSSLSVADSVYRENLVARFATSVEQASLSTSGVEIERDNDDGERNE
jgi:hypothetical protein